MWTRLSATDLAILVAFTRPFVTGERFASPPTNNKILEELAQAGLHMDLDTLRTHLRNLYAKLGVEDGLTPAEKRVRLVELVYKSRVIPGWGAEGTAERVPAAPASSPAASEATDGEYTRLALALGALRRRPLITAGLAAAFIGMVTWAVITSSGGGPSASVAPRSTDAKVIDLGLLGDAQGRVNYCTGKDVAKNSDGTLYQHQKAVVDFNARFRPRLTAKLIQFPEEAPLQYAKFSRYQRQRSGACDVFYSDVIWTADFASKRWLYDLSPYVRPRLDGFVPAMREAARFDNRLWGVPKQADAALLYYNTDTVKEPPATWQQLYELASEGRGTRFRTQGLASEALTVAFLELAYAAGAKDIITLDHKANIDQTAALDALQLMVSGIKTRAVPRNIVNQAEEKSIWAFGRGRADLMRNWPYAYTLLNDRRTYPDVAGHFAVAPLPTWNNGPPASVLGGHLLVISAFSKNPGAALKLVDFLSSPRAMKQDATEFGLAPVRVSLYSDPEVQNALPFFADLKDALDSAQVRPVTPNYQAVSDAISMNVNRALQGSLDPREALATANDAMQQALDEVPRSP
jgi:multiple sugar transport system substrate-binding protein